MMYVYVITAALMRNTGMLFANDASKERTKSIIGNIHRMGITNTVVSDYDGRHFPEVSYMWFFWGFFSVFFLQC